MESLRNIEEIDHPYSFSTRDHGKIWKVPFPWKVPFCTHRTDKMGEIADNFMHTNFCDFLEFWFHSQNYFVSSNTIMTSISDYSIPLWSQFTKGTREKISKKQNCLILTKLKVME